MLVRLSVVVSETKLAELVCAMLPELGVAAQVHPVTGDVWKQASAPGDVLLICLSRLPQPVDDSVRSLCDLPGSPKLVVLADSDDPELLANLLAAGAESVLNPTVDKQSWQNALKLVIERSREEIEELFQVGSPAQTNGNLCGGRDWLPEDWRDLPWAQLRSMLVSACEHEYIDHHLTESIQAAGYRGLPKGSHDFQPDRWASLGSQASWQAATGTAGL